MTCRMWCIFICRERFPCSVVTLIYFLPMFSSDTPWHIRRGRFYGQWKGAVVRNGDEELEWFVPIFLWFVICLTISYLPFSFTFVCFIFISFRLYLNCFVGDIFTFIFCGASCFFLFDGNFKMSEIEVAKILFKLTFVEVQSNNWSCTA